MGVEKFEWTPEGRQLLKELQIRIDINGGCEQLADAIEYEWRKGNHNKWSKNEIAYLLKNKKNLEKVARHTGRSFYGVFNKLVRIEREQKIKHQLFNN